MTISTPVSGSLVMEGTTAVLVDGENIPPSYAKAILKNAGVQRFLRIRRVYGNAALLNGWDAEPGFDLVHTGKGKNSADMKLSIDAVDIAHRGMANRFIIVSSDSDFMHLARLLRERGFAVTGIGESKALEMFQRACDQFVFLACHADATDARSNTENRIIQLIKDEGTGNSMKIALLGYRMHILHGISARTIPEMNWRAFLCARPHLFQCDQSGPTALVRLASGI
jgi:hypothetical protein